MNILNANYFQMSNAIFCYGLTPNQYAVYSYLVCCAGQKEECYPSVKTISAYCHLAENTVRKAITDLVKMGLIKKVMIKRVDRNGRWCQANNHYYIRELPDLPSRTA